MNVIPLGSKKMARSDKDQLRMCIYQSSMIRPVFRYGYELDEGSLHDVASHMGASID